MNNNSIRLLTLWTYDVKSKEFADLLKELNVDFCGYFYEDESQIMKESKFDPIYLYNKLQFYTDNNENFEPLDENIIRKMQPYEQACMDIINRWRRSYSTRESYRDIRELYYIFLAYWNNYIIKKGINCLILTAIPHIINTFVPYALCKVYDIPVIILNNMSYISGEKGNYFLQSCIEELDPDFLDRVKYYDEEYKNGEKIVVNSANQKYFDQYSQENKKIARVIGYNQKGGVLDKIKQYISRGKVYIKKGEYSVLFNKMKYIFGLKSSEKKFLKTVAKMEQNPVQGEQFLLYPLHMQPEATTLPLGGCFVDQLLIIKMIASVLPENVYLYVKEHPVYWSRKDNWESVKEGRNIRFYEDIIKLRNVRLIKHDYSSLELIDKCKCLVTVTGTAGFEAIFKMKPVMVFGNIYYNQFKSVINVRTNEECKRAVECVVNDNVVPYTKEDIAVYLKAMEKYMVTLGTIYKACEDNGIQKYDSGDIKNLADCIARYYKDYYDI